MLITCSATPVGESGPRLRSGASVVVDHTQVQKVNGHRDVEGSLSLLIIINCTYTGCSPLYIFRGGGISAHFNVKWRDLVYNGPMTCFI